jgi:hypothetical protein
MIEKSDQINELAAALSKAQAAIQPAVKDAENLGFKNAKTGKASKYADLAAVWDACRGPLSANGLSVVQLPADAEAGRVALTSMLMHSSGQYISATFSMRLMQDTPHGAGSALTYLRRYALAALVGVVADEDDDGNAASGHPAAQAQPVSPQQHTNGNGIHASDKQIGMLRGVWKQGAFDGSLEAWIVESYGCVIANLTKAQASDAIEVLQSQVKAGAANS